MTTLVNGRAADQISVADRGLHYGDGLFETVRIAAWRPCLWERHMARLQQGCRRLGFACPSVALLRSESDLLIRREGMRQGVLKIIVTRGPGGRGYQAPTEPQVTRILSVAAEPMGLTSLRRDGAAVRLCSTRLGSQPLLAGLKHLNRLEQILAAEELRDGGFQEGLMLDGQDRLVEGTRSNVFVRIGRQWRTPDLTEAGVAGIMRGLLLDTMNNNDIDVAIGPVIKEDLFRADEIVLTNSLMGLCPVRSLDGSLLAGFASTVNCGATALAGLLNQTLSDEQEAVY